MAKVNKNEAGPKLIKQFYRYKIIESIVLTDNRPELQLSDADYIQLYDFYVLHAPNKFQTHKSISLEERGWIGHYNQNGLKELLDATLDLNDKSHFDFSDKNDLDMLFGKLNLKNGVQTDIYTQRGVIGTTNASNPYLKIMYRVRDCLAHGCFKLYQVNDQQVFVMQDQSPSSVTARMVIWKSTLISWANTIKKI